jgi:hypothetical protein
MNSIYDLQISDLLFVSLCLDKIMKEWISAIEQTLEKYKKAGVGMNSISYQQEKDESAQAQALAQAQAEPSVELRKEKKDKDPESKLVRRHSTMSASVPSSKRASRQPGAGIRASMHPGAKAMAKKEAFSEESVSDEENEQFEEESEQIDDEFKSKVRDKKQKHFINFFSFLLYLPILGTLQGRCCGKC